VLDAADEFSTRVVSALHTARNTSGDILYTGKNGLADGGEWLPEIREAFDRVGVAVDEAQAREARVHLLFRDETPAGLAAAEIITRLRNVELALRKRPYSLHEASAMSTYSRNYSAVVSAQAEFSRAALQQLRDTSPQRFWRWIRERAFGRGESNA